MGTHSIKNWGGWLHRGNAWMVQLSPCKHIPDAKWWPGCIKSTCIITSPILHWDQSNSGENCIMLESRSTRSIIAKLPQHSSSAVCEFRTTSEECCKSGYGRMCVKHCCRLSRGAWSASKLAAMYVSWLYARIYHGGWLHGGPKKNNTELSKLRSGYLPNKFTLVHTYNKSVS